MLPGTIKSYKLQSFLYKVTTSGGQHACSQIHVAFHIYKTLWSATNLMKWLSYGLIVTCMGKINLGKQKGRAPRRSLDLCSKIGCISAVWSDASDFSNRSLSHVASCSCTVVANPMDGSHSVAVARAACSLLCMHCSCVLSRVEGPVATAAFIF
jgi:hypothetical protein